MGGIEHRIRQEDILRSEVSEVLNSFMNAVSAEEIAFSIARSVCNLTRARSVVYIAALEGIHDLSPLAFGAYGSTSMLTDYETWKLNAKADANFGSFAAFAKSFGWKDFDEEFVQVTNGQMSEVSRLYCRRISDHFGIFTGFLCIESHTDPFEHSDFDNALFVVSVGGLRFYQAQGNYGSQAVILQKLIHDINGSLSVIALQSELLRLKSNVENHFVEAQQRIKSALNKADASVKSLNEFSHLFYPESSQGSGLVSSAFPEVALNAALSSLALNSEQLSKIHINNAIPGYERVSVKGIVLYWIYRALVNAWFHPFLRSESGEMDVLVDLIKTEGEPGCVDAVFSGTLGIDGDFWLGMEQVPEYGVMSNQVMLMPPVIILEKMINLFGGHLILEKTDSARSITVCFPSFTE